MPVSDVVQNIDPAEQKRLIRRLTTLVLKAVRKAKGGFTPAERHELGHELSEIALSLLVDAVD